MYQEFLKSRLFRHRLYFKTDIHLAINPDLAAGGWTSECHPRPLCGGGCTMAARAPPATIRGHIGGVNN